MKLKPRPRNVFGTSPRGEAGWIKPVLLILIPLGLVVLAVVMTLRRPSPQPQPQPTSTPTTKIGAPIAEPRRDTPPKQPTTTAPPAARSKEPHVPPLEDLPAELAPGLMLTFERLAGPDDKAVQTDVRASRLAALYVPEGSPPTPFLAAGHFRATWRGQLNIDLRDTFTFSAHGRGRLKLTINDQKVLELSGDDFARHEGVKVKLGKGGNAFVAAYESPATGDAAVRLYWSSSDFAREPIPPGAFTHDANARMLRERRRLRQGRELVAAHYCLACHLPAAGDVTRDDMPELARRGPFLTDPGDRLRLEWMAHLIGNPRALRPTATMPRLFSAKQKQQPDGDKAPLPREAWDIAAYLATLKFIKKDEPARAEAPPSEADAVAGGRLFAELGCIGCHTTPDRDAGAVAADADADPNANARVPLFYEKAKWQPRALRAFLRAPHQRNPWIGMPNFGLSEDEARRLAAYLLNNSRGELTRPENMPAPDPARGKRLVQSSGCLRCHAMGLVNQYKAPALAAIRRTDWTKGCLTANAADRGRAPDFGFSAAERAALSAFAATDWSSLHRTAPAEFAGRQIRALRCLACHDRDDEQSLWTTFEEETEPLIEAALAAAGDEADEQAELDQSRPALTWTGEKLKPEWMTKLIGGRLPYKTRPWLRARMPAFTANSKLIARGLAFQHGYPPSSSPPKPPRPELAQIGRQLSAGAGADGFGCTDCHFVGRQAATNVFEAQGVNFSLVARRLNKEYFQRWMLTPLRINPQTKMTQFAEDGRTMLTDIYDGDAAKQFEAIWHYLLDARTLPPPED